MRGRSNNYSGVGVTDGINLVAWVMVGRQGARDHVHIGSRAVLGAMAGVIGDIPDGECYAGIPATPMREQSFKLAALARLPEMRKQLKRLQRLVEQRENKASNSGDKNPSHAA